MILIKIGRSQAAGRNGIGEVSLRHGGNEGESWICEEQPISGQDHQLGGIEGEGDQTLKLIVFLRQLLTGLLIEWLNIHYKKKDLFYWSSIISSPII